MIDTPPPDARRSRLLLPVILSATFMYGFDLNVVNVAVPSIQRDLHATGAALELIVGGYAFTYAAGLITGGRLGDLFTYRRMFLLGMAGFTAASVLCGLAQSPGQLVAARLLQGLTAAAMVPQVLALIMAAFDITERAKALAWFGMTAGISGVLGQVLGGLLISANIAGWDWRVIFFLNLPIGAVVLVLAARVLPRVTLGRRPRLDVVGMIGLSAALAMLLAPLALGREQGWPAWTWASMTAAVPVLAGAVLYERRLAARDRDPVLDLTLLHARTTNLGLLVNVAFMASFTGSVFTMSLLLQQGLGLTPLQAGLAFGPMALLGVLAPQLGKRLIAERGPAVTILLGSGVNLVAFLILAGALHQLGGQVGLTWLIAGLGLLGLGNMLIMPAAIAVTVATVSPTQAGSASGLLNTVQQFAGTAGLAVIGAVFFAHLTSSTATSYAHATETVLWVNIGIMLVMAGLTVLLRRAQQAAAALSGQPERADANQTVSP
ncbi:MFS transporter [Isoptericola sp. F-RaC21]|uniref:MFS transporter n=1 Tax=Isoptericola sp. F-RaC21 TaxID=3141452 RepID=UPI00315C15F5